MLAEIAVVSVCSVPSVSARLRLRVVYSYDGALKQECYGNIIIR